MSKSPRGRRRALAAGLAVAALCGACTATTGGRAPAPSAARSSATRSSAPVAAATSTAATGTAATGTAATGAPRATAGSDPLTLLPQLYGLLRLNGHVKRSTVTFSVPEPCSNVLDILGAGEWKLNVFAKPTEALRIYALSMTLGDRAAIAMLQDSKNLCTGSISAETQAALTVSGAAVASGTARSLPFYCMVGPDPSGNDEKDLVLTYIGMYRTASNAFLVLVQAPATAGTHQLVVDEEGSQGITVMPLQDASKALDSMVGFFGGMYSGAGFGGGEGDGPLRYVTDSFSGGGSIDVSSSDPFTATFSGPSLVGEMHKSQHLAITAAMSCDS